MFQLGPQIDVNALADRLLGASIIALLAGSLFLFMIARVVTTFRKPQNARTLGESIAESLAPMLATMTAIVEQSGARERESASEREKWLTTAGATNTVLERIDATLTSTEEWNKTSVERHAEYIKGILDSFSGIVDSLKLSNEALLTEIKALRESLASEAARNREHTSNVLAKEIAPVAEEVNTMSDQLDSLHAKMDARNEANGQAFKALETGLTNLKVEVVLLAAATSAEHTKIREDLLRKIDLLVKQVAALSVQPPVGPVKDLQSKDLQSKDLQSKDLQSKDAPESGKAAGL